MFYGLILNMALVSSTIAAGCFGATQFLHHDCVKIGDSFCNRVDGSTPGYSGTAAMERKNLCLQYCAGIRNTADCKPNPQLSDTCQGNADCLSAASQNAKNAADENKVYSDNAISGIENAKAGQQAHLESAVSQLNDLGRKAKSNPEMMANFQNDQKILQQVKNDLKSNNIISDEYWCRCSICYR